MIAETSEMTEVQADGNEKELVPVLIRWNKLKTVKMRPDMTVQMVIQQLTAKPNFGLIFLKHDSYHRVIGRRILENDKFIESVEGINWYANSINNKANLQLVDLSREITIMFNDYFRFSTGYSEYFLRIYPHPLDTIEEIEEEVKHYLCIDAEHDAFNKIGLYLYAKNRLSRPKDGLKIGEFRGVDAKLDDGQLFHFQFHDDSVDDAFVGVSRASNLTMKVSGRIGSALNYWFSLQGTTLFYRPDIDDFEWVEKIENINRCRIEYEGAETIKKAKKKEVEIEGEKKRSDRNVQIWRFHLIPPNGPRYSFTSHSKSRIHKWVMALKRAHLPMEIRDPMTMDALKKKFPTMEIEDASPLWAPFDPKDLEEDPFYVKPVEKKKKKKRCWLIRTLCRPRFLNRNSYAFKEDVLNDPQYDFDDEDEIGSRVDWDEIEAIFTKLDGVDFGPKPLRPVPVAEPESEEIEPSEHFSSPELSPFNQAGPSALVKIGGDEEVLVRQFVSDPRFLKIYHEIKTGELK